MAKKYRDTIEPPVYYYEGNQTILTSDLDAIGFPGMGVVHISDLAYVYGNSSLYNLTGNGFPGYAFNLKPSDYELARQMPRSFTSFASTGYPSLKGRQTLPGWTSAYHSGERGGEIYVYGGNDPGMSKLEGRGSKPTVAAQRLVERRGLLNRKDVIKQLKY